MLHAPQEWSRNGYTITTDPARFDLAAIHDFLARDSYWAKGIPMDTLRRAIDHALGFALLRDSAQVGFARVTTDRATFAYLGDVYVLQAHRGQGLARWLMQCILSHPELQGLRRWCLFTQDAHPLYREFGFTALEAPERAMELRVVRSYVS